MIGLVQGPPEEKRSEQAPSEDHDEGNPHAAHRPRMPWRDRNRALAGFALVEPVDLRAATGVELALHAREADVDAAPAGGDEVDEEREVVDACVPLGHEVVLEALEAADRLSGQPAHFGELPAHRGGLGAD